MSPSIHYIFWLDRFPSSLMNICWECSVRYLGCTGWSDVKLKSGTVVCLSTGNHKHRQRESRSFICCFDSSSDQMYCRLLTKQWEHLTAWKYNSSCRLTPHTGVPTNLEKTHRNISNKTIKNTLISNSQPGLVVPQGGNYFCSCQGVRAKISEKLNCFKKSIERKKISIKYRIYSWKVMDKQKK